MKDERRWRDTVAALREWSGVMLGATARLDTALGSAGLVEQDDDLVGDFEVAVSPDARRERLWRWRREEARRRGVAPYFVLTNAVVERLSSMEVLGREDLRRVPGIGPRKLDAYGDAILQVLGGARLSASR